MKSVVLVNQEKRAIYVVDMNLEDNAAEIILDKWLNDGYPAYYIDHEKEFKDNEELIDFVSKMEKECIVNAFIETMRDLIHEEEVKLNPEKSFSSN